MKYNSKSGIESRMKNAFSAMRVILSVAKYKFTTSSDTSEFAKTESYYYDNNGKRIRSYERLYS